MLNLLFMPESNMEFLISNSIFLITHFVTLFIVFKCVYNYENNFKKAITDYENKFRIYSKYTVSDVMKNMDKEEYEKIKKRFKVFSKTGKSENGYLQDKMSFIKESFDKKKENYNLVMTWIFVVTPLIGVLNLIPLFGKLSFFFNMFSLIGYAALSIFLSIGLTEKLVKKINNFTNYIRGNLKQVNKEQNELVTCVSCSIDSRKHQWSDNYCPHCKKTSEYEKLDFNGYDFITTPVKSKFSTLKDIVFSSYIDKVNRKKKKEEIVNLIKDKMGKKRTGKEMRKLKKLIDEGAELNYLFAQADKVGAMEIDKTEEMIQSMKGNHLEYSEIKPYDKQNIKKDFFGS